MKTVNAEVTFVTYTDLSQDGQRKDLEDIDAWDLRDPTIFKKAEILIFRGRQSSESKILKNRFD